jgi:2Fe-2S ferredoxin
MNDSSVCEIIIENLDNKAIRAATGNHSFLEIFLNSGVDFLHSCGGKGRCTTCSMIVLEGDENISKPSTPEVRYLNLGALPQGRILACQSIPLGNVVISVPDEFKLPHLSYTDD